eukprot:s4736_g4.t1
MLEDGDEDTMHALQTSACRIQADQPIEGIDLPTGTDDTECTGFQFRLAARAFQPGNLAHLGIDDTIHDLHSQWTDRAFSWEGEAPTAQFLVWYLAPGGGRLRCLYSKRVTLSEDFWNWKNQMQAVWRDDLIPGIDCDIVAVSPRPTHLEPGTAGHAILVQIPQVEITSILISVFDHAINAGHPFKQAHAVPAHITAREIITAVGYHWDCSQIAQCEVFLRGQNLQLDEHIRSADGDAFDLFVTRPMLPVTWIAPFMPHRPGSEGLNLVQTGARLMPRKSSLTEEFLATIRAAENAVDNTPQIDDHDAIEAQPAFVQEIWEHWQDLASRNEAFQEPVVRIETWYVDHVRNDRCWHSRTVVLPREFVAWEATLLAAWADRAVLGQETHFALVYPDPEDMANGAIMQMIIVQQAVDEKRSIILTIYDTDPEVDPLRTFCITLTSQISLDSLLEVLHLADDCPPQTSSNECFLWFGAIPIHAHRVIHLRTGNALRLVLRRGIPIDIPSLLSLPDHMLRRELQAAIGGTIFRRPAGPAFMESVSASSSAVPMQVGNERIQVQTGRRPNDPRPDWLVALDEIFQNHAFVEMEEEGPVMYVLVWFLHGTHNSRCIEPRVARLHGPSFEWRTDLVFTWRDSLRRGESIEFHLVQPDPPKSPWQSHVANILMTQNLSPGQVPALPAFLDHLACILPSTVALTQLHILIVPATFQRRPTRASRGNQILPIEFDATTAPGDNILFEILADPNGTSEADDDSSLLQQPHVPLATSAATDEKNEPMSSSDVKIDLQRAIETFEWLDAHFLLLDFVFPDEVNIPTESREWTNLPIWDPSMGCEEIILHFDGSYQPAHGQAGLAVAVYVRRQDGWYQGGFLSAVLADVGSYVAELQAAIIAAKIAHDLTKLVVLAQHYSPQIWFGYDSASVGNQLLGKWKSVQHPMLGRCARLLIELLKTRFQIACQGWHIQSHRGDSGNELVDALANAAAMGFATHDDSHFLESVGRKKFVDAGHYGIVMGCNCKNAHGQIATSDGKGRDVYFKQEYLSSVARDPRILIVRARTPALKCIFIAAHAPHTGASENEIAQWWQKLQSLVPPKYDAWDRILLVDANARVGGFPSESAGSWQAEEDSDKSGPFLDYLHQQSLWLPATFEDYQQGPGGTWCHNSGKWLRNDFNWIPEGWSYEKVSASVSTEIDLSTVKEDHAVAMVSLQAAGQPLPQRHIVRVPKRAESDLQPDIEFGIAQPFHVDWSVDVHTHADRIQAHVLSCIPKMRKKNKPLKTTMSEHTWTLVQEMKFWRNQMWDCNRAQRMLWMRTCFDAWNRKHDSSNTVLKSDIAALNRQHDLLVATAYHQFRHLGLRVSNAMRKDDALFFDALSRQASEFPGPHQAREFWRIIRRSIPKMRQRRQAERPMMLEHLEEQEQSEYATLLRKLNIGVEAIVWSDDMAVPWLTQRASDLPSAIQTLLAKIHQIFTRRGFDLNLQKGKTTAVVTFRGKGAPDLRREYQTGFEAEYERVARPVHLQGIDRANWVPAAGPANLMPDKRIDEVAECEKALQDLQMQYHDCEQPPHADDVRERLFDKWTSVTRQWFCDFCEASYDANVLPTLSDRWIDTFAIVEPEYDLWTELCFREWGQNGLGDVIAGFEDGEAEFLADQAYLDLFSEMPLFECDQKCTHLRARIRSLPNADPDVPHRNV